MREQDSGTSEFEWTPTALGFARAYYAGAMLAARQQPDDRHRQQRAAEAWAEYREAARKAGQLSALLPSGFAQEQD
jgi:hypothetical protein